MAKSTRANQRALSSVQPQIKVWVELDGKYVLGRGICDILIAVAHCGSIKQAASSVGRSYRHIWDRIKQAEKTLGITLVETKVGGNDEARSVITPAARSMIEDFEGFRSRMKEHLAAEFPGHLRKLLAAAQRVERQ